MDVPVTCLSNVETDFRKMLLQSGLDVTNCKPIRLRGRNSNLEVFTTSLCQCIKVYNNRYIKELASLSTAHVASIVAICRHGIRDPEELTYSPDFGKNVVRVTICKTCPENVVKDFINGLQNIKYTNFPCDMVKRIAVTADEKSEESEASTPIPVSPGSKLVAGIKALEKLMKELQYSLHKGKLIVRSQRGSLHL